MILGIFSDKTMDDKPIFKIKYSYCRLKLLVKKMDIAGMNQLINEKSALIQRIGKRDCDISNVTVRFVHLSYYFQVEESCRIKVSKLQEEITCKTSSFENSKPGSSESEKVAKVLLRLSLWKCSETDSKNMFPKNVIVNAFIYLSFLKLCIVPMKNYVILATIALVNLSVYWPAIGNSVCVAFGPLYCITSFL